ncbi:MAG: hypothetical protein CL557_12570 [Alphaproteobacteria bacterium]|nr:hypothetical protein [Alphaproteobacteria bacterium]
MYLIQWSLRLRHREFRFLLKLKLLKQKNHLIDKKINSLDLWLMLALLNLPLLLLLTRHQS